MAIEQYARAEAVCFNTTCHPGLEYGPDDDVNTLTQELQFVAYEALTSADFYVSEQQWHNKVSGFVAGWILSNYPDRAYFVETEIDGRGVQVYDPGNYVKERCVCKTV